MEFFATYDVMTGVRIAATLGGFFGLMVFLIVYKSRGENHDTMKALKVTNFIGTFEPKVIIFNVLLFQDPKIAAVAAAVMQEEEEREIQEALEASGIFPEEISEQYFGYRRRRMLSVGNISAPPVLNSNHRLNSISKRKHEYLFYCFAWKYYRLSI